jgi:hypothetical protein
MATAKKKPEPKPNDNLKLWNAVCITDPAYTKKADTRGGFTSINATWQAWQATELWGPYGKEWGMKNIHYDFIGPEDHPAGIYILAEFFCPVTKFEIGTDMPYKPNDDCFKKLLTDATTKALSKLGFSADVFFGMYDDNRYVQAAAQTYSDHRAAQNGATPPPAESPTQPDAPPPEAATEPPKAIVARLLADDKDLIKAWHLEPLTERSAPRVVSDLIEIVMSEVMPDGWDESVDLYQAARKKMNLVIDERHP